MPSACPRGAHPAVPARHLAGATAVALGLAEPLAATAFAVTIVGERPGGVAAAGLLTGLAGLALLVRSELPAWERADVVVVNDERVDVGFDEHVVVTDWAERSRILAHRTTPSETGS